MLGKQADRLLRTDWNTLGTKAFAEELYALFSSNGEMIHDGNVTLHGDNDINMQDVDVQSLKWGKVSSQSFADDNSSYVDIKEADNRTGGMFGAIRRVYQAGMGLIGGVESRPVDHIAGDYVGFQLDSNGDPFVLAGTGNTPPFRVAIAGEKFRSGSMPTPNGPFSATLLRTPDEGATWTSTGQEISVFNPGPDKVPSGSRVVIFKDPTKDFYVYWMECNGWFKLVGPSDGSLPVDPGCECGGLDPSGELDTVGLGSSTACTDNTTVTALQGAPFVSNLPACIKVQFSGVIDRCCENCMDGLNLTDDCYLYFIHRSAFDADPGRTDTQGHGYQATGPVSEDQWYLASGASPAVLALLHAFTNKAGADADDCPICKNINDDTSAYPSEMQVVMYPTHQNVLACSMQFLDDDTYYTSTDPFQQFNPNRYMMFCIQFGSGEATGLQDAQATYYFTEPLNSDDFIATSTPLDMSTITTMTFTARCTKGYYGYSSPNEPPAVGNPELDLGAASGQWDHGGCYYYNGSTYEQHGLSTNYNCGHMENDASDNVADTANYANTEDAWLNQCMDGTAPDAADKGHTCAQATATWIV
jgi:hypothetical protein